MATFTTRPTTELFYTTPFELESDEWREFGELTYEEYEAQSEKADQVNLGEGAWSDREATNKYLMRAAFVVAVRREARSLEKLQYIDDIDYIYNYLKEKKIGSWIQACWDYEMPWAFNSEGMSPCQKRIFEKACSDIGMCD
jgi:hypothetical protein